MVSHDDVRAIARFAWIREDSEALVVSLESEAEKRATQG
jgi:hypothetical protein